MKLKGSLTTPTCGRFYGKKLNLVVLSQLVGFFNSLLQAFLHLLETSVLSQILEEGIKDIFEELRSPIGVLVTDIGFGGSS